MGSEVDATLAAGQTTLHLRLLAALIRLTEDTEMRNRMVLPILSDAALSNAAPYPLLVIAEESRNRGNTALARKRFGEVIATASGPLEQEARRRLARLEPPQDREEHPKD